MQLAELGDQKSPSVVQGPRSGRESGDEVPQKSKIFCTFVHNILHFLPYAVTYVINDQVVKSSGGVHI